MSSICWLRSTCRALFFGLVVCLVPVYNQLTKADQIGHRAIAQVRERTEISHVSTEFFFKPTSGQTARADDQ